MCEKFGRLGIVSYNTMLKGFTLTGEIPAAYTLLSEMEWDGITPNDISYNSIVNSVGIDVCSEEDEGHGKAEGQPRPSLGRLWHCRSDGRTFRLAQFGLSSSPGMHALRAKWRLQGQRWQQAKRRRLLRRRLWHGRSRGALVKAAAAQMHVPAKRWLKWAERAVAEVRGLRRTERAAHRILDMPAVPRRKLCPCPLPACC